MITYSILNIVVFQLKPNQLNDNAFWMKINETDFETPDLLMDLDKIFSTSKGGTPFNLLQTAYIYFTVTHRERNGNGREASI